jgi:hypothetical protein
VTLLASRARKTDMATGNADSGKSAGGRDCPAFGKDRRSIGIVVIPPPKEGRRDIDGRLGELEPGKPELRLETEPPRRPLPRGHGRSKHDQKHDEDLTPEDFCCSQAGSHVRAGKISDADPVQINKRMKLVVVSAKSASKYLRAATHASGPDLPA